MTDSLIYLASPYSHPSEETRIERFRSVCATAAKLMAKGYKIFSPIAHTHPIAEAGQLPTGWDYWDSYDRAILSCCKEIWVLRLKGWEFSKGIGAELDIAKELGLTIRFLTAEGEFDE